MPLTQKWDGTGNGLPTSPWKRNSLPRKAVVTRGTRAVGTSGTIAETTPASKPAEPCRFCQSKVWHVCQKSMWHPDGNGPEVSSKSMGYRQYHVAHPTKPMRSIRLVRDKHVPKSKGRVYGEIRWL